MAKKKGAKKPKNEKLSQAAKERWAKAKAAMNPVEPLGGPVEEAVAEAVAEIPVEAPVEAPVEVSARDKVGYKTRYVTGPGKLHAFDCKRVKGGWECWGDSFEGGPFRVKELAELDLWEFKPFPRRLITGEGQEAARLRARAARAA